MSTTGQEDLGFMNQNNNEKMDDWTLNYFRDLYNCPPDITLDQHAKNLLTLQEYSNEVRCLLHDLWEVLRTSGMSNNKDDVVIYTDGDGHKLHGLLMKVEKYI